MGLSRRLARPASAVVVVGTELVTGHRADTNGEEIARVLAAAGFRMRVREALADDTALLAERLRALCGEYELVVVTGGLGPTHDDVTREAAAQALGVSLVRDASLEAALTKVAESHREPRARAQVMRQADVLPGAKVFNPSSGTAPGQLVRTERGHLLLLPGPPRELRPMLAEALECLPRATVPAPRVIGCVDIRESDVQLVAERVLAAYPGISLTVLARPALVDVALFDEGAGDSVLERAATDVAEALADTVYATSGDTLAETVIGLARGSGFTLACAESCTGGMIASSLTAVPGASTAFLGSAVTYSDALKTRVLHVSPESISSCGAVSAAVVSEMASGARALMAADLALAVSGIAGPGGGTPRKPVGTVWFAIATAEGVTATHRIFPGDRHAVRERATVIGLDLLRREMRPSGPPRT